MSVTLERFKAPTPEYFKPILVCCVWIAAFSTGIEGIIANLPFVIPIWVHGIFTGLASSCFGIVGIIKLIVDTDKATKEQIEKIFPEKSTQNAQQNIDANGEEKVDVKKII